MLKESIQDKVIGTWKFVSWVYKNENNQIIDYFGKGAVGILMYDRSGYMNVQIMKAGRMPFVSDAIYGGTAEETRNAFDSYIAYFGKYYESSPGELVHVVEGSLFPNWLGDKQMRYGKLVGNQLVLHTAPIPTSFGNTVFYLTWERVRIA
jgi:Lipocalin-like domain